MKLNNSIIDLKARSMRNNLLFFNIAETDEENTTEIIHSLLEEKLEMRDAQINVKIDRAHQLGWKRNARDHRHPERPRPIVVKFNYFQDRENVRKMQKSSRDQQLEFQNNFQQERKKLYPIFKQAKNVNKRVSMVRGQAIY